MTGRGLLAGLLLAGTATTPGLEVALTPYRAAVAAGHLGQVSGRAYEERRTPDGPDRPLAGAGVVLVPRSEPFLARLAAIKDGARGSLAAYRVSAGAVRRLREDFEHALREAGGADLVRATVVDREGAFGLDGVPAGAWLLIATHTASVERRSPPASRKEQRTFTPRPRLVGYQAVTVWLRELEVGAGRVETVELTDRNGWLVGVVEETVPDAGR